MTSLTAYLTVTALPLPVPGLSPADATDVPRLGQVYPLIPGKNTLGRLAPPDSTIFLPWLHVSRRQALIELFSPGSWEIEDLQSRNGTLVNDQRLEPNVLHPLNDGDRIIIPALWGIEFRFSFAPPPPPPEERRLTYEEFLEMDEFR